MTDDKVEAVKRVLVSQLEHLPNNIDQVTRAVIAEIERYDAEQQGSGIHG